jgi:hypothetical protein
MSIPLDGLWQSHKSIKLKLKTPIRYNITLGRMAKGGLLTKYQKYYTLIIVTL